MIGNWNRCIEISKTDYTIHLHYDDLIVSSFFSNSWTIIQSKRDIGILKPSIIKQIMDHEKTKVKEKICRLFDFEVVRQTTIDLFKEHQPFLRNITLNNGK